MAARKRHSLTVEEVEKETTLLGLMRMFKELNLKAPDGKGKVEVLKQCLISHIQQGGTKKTLSMQQWDTTTEASNEDLDNRTQLRNMYKEAIAYIQSLQAPFRNNLNQIFPNCIGQMNEYMEELKSSKSTLLVAGEMSAGKSSLVNLLVGSSILPTSDLRCTAAIVEISYGELPRAEMYFRDDSSGRALRPIKIESSERIPSRQFKAEVDSHIMKIDDETDESPYEKIQLFWPLEVLKGGVMIVDSPGVGDSRSLPQQLAEYMKQAFGFIYVIDSTAAVHKHRLGQLLLKALEANGNFFDPHTALFVCNRWDMVQPEDSEKVKTAIIDRLSMILPGIRRSQLYPISVKHAAISVEYGQITPEHEALNEGIRRFLPQAMRGKLRTYYRYLSTILKRSLYYIRVSFVAATKNVNDMQKDVKDCDKKINILQKTTEEKLNEMRRELKAASIEAAENILQYVKSMKTRIGLLTWQDSECPRKEKWQNVLKNATLLIRARLTGVVNRWEENSEFEERVVKDIVNKFEKRFELWNHQVKEIEGIFLPAEDQITVLDFHRSMKRPSGLKITPKPSKKSKDDNYLSIGAAVATVCTLSAKNADVKKLFKDKFDKDQKNVMAAVTEMCLANLNEVSVVTAINKYFDRFMKGIDEVGKLFPSMLKANQTFLVDLSKNLDTEESALRIYPPLSQKCGDIRGALDMFYLQRLLVTDFTFDQLTYTEKDALGHGSFASVYKATLRLGSQAKVVALKEPREYITNHDVSDLLLEESILREVDHENIVKYYGMYRKGPQHKMRLNMVMEYCSTTLKARFIDNGNHAPSKFGSNPPKQQECIGIMTGLLTQIIKGLSYLHGKGIVHRDLKPENILLTENNCVKIADLGLAKKVKDILTTAIGTPVYMAPEVLLLSDKYDTKADIYSLAMIIWELWYGTDLAHYASMELQGGLKNSIMREWRPSLSITAAPTDVWKKLIRNSWDQVPTKRPSYREIDEYLQQITAELCKSQSALSSSQ